MTTIRTQSGNEYELESWLDDVIADTGGFENFTRDEDGVWVMPDEDAEWWVDYEAREIRIMDAMDEPDEDRPCFDICFDDDGVVDSVLTMEDAERYLDAHGYHDRAYAGQAGDWNDPVFRFENADAECAGVFVKYL